MFKTYVAEFRRRHGEKGVFYGVVMSSLKRYEFVQSDLGDPNTHIPPLKTLPCPHLLKGLSVYPHRHENAQVLGAVAFRAGPRVFPFYWKAFRRSAPDGRSGLFDGRCLDRTATRTLWHTRKAFSGSSELKGAGWNKLPWASIPLESLLGEGRGVDNSSS
ncbi:unnamed protein product, partial [Hapterophycus canaliculatus]